MRTEAGTKTLIKWEVQQWLDLYVCQSIAAAAAAFLFWQATSRCSSIHRIQ